MQIYLFSLRENYSQMYVLLNIARILKDKKLFENLFHETDRNPEHQPVYNFASVWYFKTQ